MLGRTAGLLGAVALILGSWLLMPHDLYAPVTPLVAVYLVWSLIAPGRRELVVGGAIVSVATVAISLGMGVPVAGALLSAVAVLTAGVLGRAVTFGFFRRAVRGRPDAAELDPARFVTLMDSVRLTVCTVPGLVVACLVHQVGMSVGHDMAWSMQVGRWILQTITGAVVLGGPFLAVRSALIAHKGIPWRRRARIFEWPSLSEIVALLVLTGVVQWLVFGSGSNLPVGYATLLLVVWGGMRLPLPGATLHGALLGLGAFVFVQAGIPGPFSAVGSPVLRTIAVEGYMLVAIILATMLAGAMDERQTLTRSLAESEREARAKAEAAERLFADAPNGNVLLSPEGEVLRINATTATMLDASTAYLVGMRLDDLPGDQSHSLTRYLARAVAHPEQLVEGDWTVQMPDRDPLHTTFLCRVLPGYDEGRDAVLVNIVDVSDRYRYEQRLSHMAEHDVLTGLANRRHFDRVLMEHQQRCERYGPRGALILMDLDNFKDVNDTLGHAAGDEVIVTVATVLRRSFRATDVVARIGGDEFAVLLPEADQAQAELVANNVVRGVANWAATLDGVHRRVSASAGVVTFLAAAKLEAEPLALADMMMYDAKEAGKNGYAALEEENTRQPRTGAQMAWRSRIERALAEGRFELHLQPILDLATNRVASAEALVRLVDQDEIVYPGRFMYIVEKAGLAPALDSWVVDRAVQILARLREHDPRFVLEVNVSAQSLGAPQLEKALMHALETYGVDPCGLVLEVTETAAVADLEVARAFSRRVSALGARFALDDFGAGFGSYYYLKHLESDLIKIDGEFVAKVHSSEVDAAVVRSIVSVAKELGKQTVAEFVSEEATLHAVRELGVDFAQGFLVGRPVPETQFVTSWLENDGDVGHAWGQNG